MEAARLRRRGKGAARGSEKYPLLALAEPAQDTVVRHWRKERGRLVCEMWSVRASDLRAIIRHSCRWRQVLHLGHRHLHKRWNGFSLVGGKMQNENATKRDFKLEEGHEYLSEVQVRKDGLKAFIDGQLAGEWKTDYSDMGTEPFWKLRHERQLGIGSWASEAIFSKIEVREITGTGRLLRGGSAAGAPAPPNVPPPPPPPRKPPL